MTSDWFTWQILNERAFAIPIKKFFSIYCYLLICICHLAFVCIYIYICIYMARNNILLVLIEIYNRLISNIYICIYIYIYILCIMLIQYKSIICLNKNQWDFLSSYMYIYIWLERTSRCFYWDIYILSLNKNNRMFFLATHTHTYIYI